ncbi:hypothetical protein Tco_1276146 [Tanacetum coccineum]
MNTMATPNLNGTHTTPCLANPRLAEQRANNKIEISKEILVELQNNAFNGAEEIKIQKVDQQWLCIFAFPNSLTGKARKWWIDEENHKITSWVELVDKFFYKYYPLSRASKTNDSNVRECHLKFMNWLSTKIKNPWKLSTATKNALWNFWEKGYDNDTLVDDEESSDEENDGSNPMEDHPSVNPYLKTTEEGNKSHHIKCNCGSKNFAPNDAPYSGNNNQGNEGICRVDKFEVIKYLIGNNEEFMGIRTLERDSWAQTVNGISSIYLDIFRKKDEGWTVHRTK